MNVEARVISRHEFMVRATLVAVLTLLAPAACGGGGGPAGAVGSPSASPLAPSGGPVPSELAGAWQLVADPTKDLKLSGTDYLFGDGSAGNVAVNGSEIDFYNGEPCGIPLPGGIGRYHWSVETGSLKLVNINSDPCARLSVLAEAQGWRRAP